MQRNIEHHHQYINAHNKQPQTEAEYDSINPHNNKNRKCC
jgi:hypothetical protein